MLVVDEHALCVDANAAAGLVLRRTPESLRGVALSDIAGHRDAAVVARSWQRLLSRPPSHGRWTWRPSGEEAVELDWCVRPILGSDAHVLAVAPANWSEQALTPPPGALSDRERTALALLAAGDDVRAIASQLSISEATVKTHLLNAVRRLRARGRVHAVAIALRAGMLDP